MLMYPYATYLMSMTLEKGKSGNAIKDFVEQFRKNMFIEDDIEEEQYFDDEEDDDTEPTAEKEDKKKTLYISLNVFVEDWDFFFTSDLYEPHEVTEGLIEELILVDTCYYRDAISIKLDDLTDEKILAHSKEITGEEKMPIVEFYREDNGSIDIFIGFYYKDFQECENPNPD